MDESNNTLIVISREDAKAQGLKRYFTGIPCKHGHVAERYVSKWACTACVRDYSKARNSAAPEKVKEWCRSWKSRNKEKVSAYNQKWNAENAELRSSLGREWREANKEKVATDLAAWRESNRDLSRAYIHRRRALLLSAEGSHTAQDIKEIYAAQKGRCAYCKIKVGDKYHVDHIQPLIKGGSNDKRNLQICCPTCNNRKHAKDPIAFAQELGLLL
jgi:5-methylcytosine-specific restriction endonuclease McrA